MKAIGLSRLILISLSVLLLVTSTVLALPQTINYQGLLEEDGVPVDGTKSVRFRIYDSASGGTYLWEEIQSVTFTSGVFSVLLGSTQPISSSVFDGGRRWISVSIDDGSELSPRGEIVSVGYAFYSATSDTASYAGEAGAAQSADYATEAGDSDRLDGLDSSQLAGSGHVHDSRYYRQSQLNTSDGSPPNQGSELVHWYILTGVPDGFADGVDDTGAPGTTDHGQLTGLLDDDHPQYALRDSLKISDGTPPNQGRNEVHWSVLLGVPSGFADETDNITTNASLITTGTMSPQRIEGTAIVNSDSRLLTIGQKDGLTGGGTTTLHSHTEIGDISSVSAGQGLSGGGTSDGVTLSHAGDASALPFAHHTPPIVAHTAKDDFQSDATNPTVVDSLMITVPDTGSVYVSFSASQLLYLKLEGPPPQLRPKRYIGKYGVSIDQASAIDYEMTSSMQDTLFWAGGLYLPAKTIGGSTVFNVSPGTHTVYFLAEIILVVDSGAVNNLEGISLSAIYLPYDSASFTAAMLTRDRQQGHAMYNESGSSGTGQ